jgi:hypothetical protein
MPAWLLASPATQKQEAIMQITRKTMVVVAATAIALFAVASPLGDAHHGLGRHHAFLADLGQVLFTTFLITCVVFVAIVAVALVQSGLRSRRARGAR